MKIKRYDTEFEVVDDTICPEFWSKHPEWEAYNYRKIREHAFSCHTFVSVGTWIGPFTLFAAKHYERVIGFEPESLAFNEVSRNVILNNYSNVELNNVAVASFNGTLQLGECIACPKGMSRTSFLYDGDKFSVKCETLRKIYADRGLTTRTCLKIDIEGGEYNLFDDIDFFIQNKPTLIVECHQEYLNPDQTEHLRRGLENVAKHYDVPFLLEPIRNTHCYLESTYE
jgi:FkbM family methyltransferase